MRIAFCVSSFPELSETFLLRQVTGLIDRGHDVAIFAEQPARDDAVHPAVELYGLQRLVRVMDPRMSDSPAARPRAHRQGMALSLRAARLAADGLLRGRASGASGRAMYVRTLARLAGEEPFDVVHCHYGEIGLRLGVAARLWRAPLVVSFYGYDSSSYPRSHGHRVYASLFRDADIVTSLSGHMDAQLRELGCPAANIRRVPLAVDPAMCQPREDSPAAGAARDDAVVRILTVARLTEKKGIEYALRALADVVGEFPGVRYDIIGEGPLRDSLLALTGALGLDTHVRFLGARTDVDVREAMRESDLFLLPSVTAASGDEEGTPTAIIEAAFFGLPVIATTHAGIPELVCDGEGGYLVPERDPAALANALRALLRAPERWPAMGAAARRHVEPNHALPAVAARLERVYEEARVRHRARTRAG